MIALAALFTVALAVPQLPRQPTTGLLMNTQPGRPFDLRCEENFGIQELFVRRQGEDVVLTVKCAPIVPPQFFQKLEKMNCRDTEPTDFTTGTTFEQTCNQNEFLVGIQSENLPESRRNLRVRCCRINNVEMKFEETYISRPIDMLFNTPQQTTINRIQPEVRKTGVRIPIQIITRLQFNTVMMVAQYGFLRLNGIEYQPLVELPENRPLFKQEVEKVPKLNNEEFSTPNEPYRMQCEEGKAIVNVEVKTITDEQQEIQTRYQCKPVVANKIGKFIRRMTHFQTPTKPSTERQLIGCVRGEYVCGVVRTMRQDNIRYALECCSNGEIRTVERETITFTVTPTATDLLTQLRRLTTTQNVRLINFAFTGPQRLTVEYGRIEAGKPQPKLNNNNINNMFNTDDLTNFVFGQSMPTVGSFPFSTPFQGMPFPFNTRGTVMQQNIVEIERFTCPPNTGIRTWMMINDETTEDTAEPTETNVNQPMRKYQFECRPVVSTEFTQQTGPEQCRFTEPRPVFYGLKFNEMDNCQSNEYMTGVNRLQRNGKPLFQLRCCRLPNMNMMRRSCYTTVPQNMLFRPNTEVSVFQTGRIEGVRTIEVPFASELMQSVQFNSNMEVVAKYCVFHVNGQHVPLTDITTTVPPTEMKLNALPRIQPGQMTPSRQAFRLRCPAGQAVTAMKVQRTERRPEELDIQLQTTCSNVVAFLSREFRRFTPVTNENNVPLPERNTCTPNEYICGVIGDYSNGRRAFGLECCSAAGMMRDTSVEPTVKTVELTETPQALISEQYGNGDALQRLIINNMNEVKGVFARFLPRNGPTGQGMCVAREVFDPSKTLTTQAFFHVQTPDLTTCVMMCNQHPFCLSAGFQPSTGGDNGASTCIMSYGQGFCPKTTQPFTTGRQSIVDQTFDVNTDDMPDFETVVDTERLPETFNDQIPEFVPRPTTTNTQLPRNYPQYLKPVADIPSTLPVWLTCIRCE